MLFDYCYSLVLNDNVAIGYFYHSHVKLYHMLGMILSMPCLNVN